jgi:hypothetical protein
MTSFLKRRTSNAATPHPLERVIKEGVLAKQGCFLTTTLQIIIIRFHAKLVSCLCSNQVVN